MLLFVRSLPWLLVYDETGITTETPPTAEETAAAAAAEELSNKEKKPTVKFSPEQQGYINSLLAEERRKAQKKNELLITQLETEKNRAGTTTAEKTALEERIEALRAEFTTKDELAQKETKKKVTELEKRVNIAETEAKTWRDRFESNKIEVDLTAAAVAHKAYQPKQVVTQLRPLTRLVEETDDSGKPTGAWSTRVKIQGKDKDGNTVTMDLVANEAVKQLAEMVDEYGNLFSANVAGGLGSGTLANRATGTGDKNPAQMSTEEYLAYRKKNKGTSRR